MILEIIKIKLKYKTSYKNFNNKNFNNKNFKI